MTRVWQRHRGPKIRIVDRNLFVTIHQLQQLVVSSLELVVVTNHRDVVRHPLAHLLVQYILVLVTALLDQLLVDLLLKFQLLIVDTRSVSAVALDVLRELDRSRRSDKPAKHATDKRICAETIRTMNRVIAFTGRQQTGNVCALVEVDPESAHRIVHARKDAHRHVTRIVADEHLVNLENRAELSVQNFSGNVCEIEIHLVITTDTPALDTHLKDLTSRDVARHKIAIRWILLFEEIPALALGN